MEKSELTLGEEMELIKKSSAPVEVKEAKMMRLAEIFGDRLAEHISPTGKLDAPLVHDHPLLEQRRVEYGIPDEAFAQEAVYDRIFVFQIPRVFGEKIEGSMLYKPQTARQREEESTPRGIIVSAGLKALDNIRSHGMDVGHIVNFIRLAPFRIPYLTISGQELWLLVMRDGDIISSEELPILRKKGHVATRMTVSSSGEMSHTIQHYTVTGTDVDGRIVKPAMPFIAEDH